jgi:arylsulfatase
MPACASASPGLELLGAEAVDVCHRGLDGVGERLADRLGVEGVVVVQKDSDGEVHVTETGDHLGRRGVKVGGGVGLVVGLFAPPLLAATAVGAAAGGAMSKLVKHRLESGVAEKMDAATAALLGRRDGRLRL